MKYLSWLLLVSLIIFPVGASAAVFINDEQALSLKGPVEDDLFATGETVLIDQPITGDLFAAGERVTVSTTVSEDTFAAGGIVEISGEIADDVFVAGNTVTIAGTTDDLFAAGNEVTFDTSSSVTGDAYVTGQTVELGGTFAGDVRVAGQTIVVGEGTTINGDLISHGHQPLIESGVTIKGTQRHEQVRQKATQAGIGSLLVSVGMWFVMAMLVSYLLPGFTAGIVTQSPQIFKTFAIGLGWLILFIPVAVILAMSIIGIPLMIAVLLITALLLLSATTYTTLFIAHWVQTRRLGSAIPLSWHYILLGAVIYSLLSHLPIIGMLLCFILTVWVFGMLLRGLWSRRQATSTTNAS